MTTQLSVIEVAELYGFNRQTVYKRINKGELSKNSDGKIDLAEAIRVFGEPASKNNQTTPIHTGEYAHNSTDMDMLREQVDMLKEQLRLAVERERVAREREDVALDREQFYQNQIEAMQRLLMAPKPPESNTVQTSAQNDSKPNGDQHHKTESADVNMVDKDLHEATPGDTQLDERSTSEKPKKGFWSSLFQ